MILLKSKKLLGAVVTVSALVLSGCGNPSGGTGTVAQKIQQARAQANQKLETLKQTMETEHNKKKGTLTPQEEKCYQIKLKFVELIQKFSRTVSSGEDLKPFREFAKEVGFEGKLNDEVIRNALIKINSPSCRIFIGKDNLKREAIELIKEISQLSNEEKKKLNMELKDELEQQFKGGLSGIPIHEEVFEGARPGPRSGYSTENFATMLKPQAMMKTGAFGLSFGVVSEADATETLTFGIAGGDQQLSVALSGVNMPGLKAADETMVDVSYVVGRPTLYAFAHMMGMDRVKSMGMMQIKSHSLMNALGVAAGEASFQPFAAVAVFSDNSTISSAFGSKKAGWENESGVQFGVQSEKALSHGLTFKGFAMDHYGFGARTTHHVLKAQGGLWYNAKGTTLGVTYTHSNVANDKNGLSASFSVDF